MGYVKSGTNYRTIQKAAIGGGVQGQEGPGMQYNCSNIYDNVTNGLNLSKHIGMQRTQLQGLQGWLPRLANARVVGSPHVAMAMGDATVSLLELMA